MSVRLLFLLSLFVYARAAQNNCFFNHTDGYSLRWLVIGDEILFHLEFPDFPVNTYTGVGFEKEDDNDSESIIVQVSEEGGVDVFATSQNSDSTVLSEDTVAVLNSDYRDNALQAEFSRSLVTKLTDLNECLTWNFFTTPRSNNRTRNYGGRFRVPSIVKICDVKRDCNVWNQLESKLLGSSEIIPRISAVLENYRKMRANFPLNNPHYLKSHFFGENREKRQSGSSYKPTDNIYGYDYRSSASDSNAAKLIVNPNYNFLNDNLTKGYAKNYADAERNYEQNSGSQGTLPGSVAMNDAIVSNEQQNTINYQRIQQTSYNNPTTTQQYSNNIYGYAYADSSPVRSGPQIVRGQTSPMPTNYRVSSISTPAPSAPYRSVVDLKTTRLRDPSSSSSGNVYSSGSSGQQAMFYPYRTDTQTVYGGSQTSSSQSSSQLSGSQLSAGTLFRDANTDPCSLSDPYWCSDYVKIYLDSSTKLNRLSKQTACQALAQSLQDSYNGCCQTMRAAGCR